MDEHLDNRAVPAGAARVRTPWRSARVAAPACLLALCACGTSAVTGTGSAVVPSRTSTAPTSSAPASSPSTSASQPPSSAPSSVASAIDPCLVGTWVGTGVSGSVSDGSVTIELSGGGGQVTVIRADGIVATNYSASQPVTGAGSDGATYSFKTTGAVTGTLVTSGGQATLTIDDPSGGTQTVEKNGTVVGQSHPPKTQTSSYTCTPNGLQIVSDHVTTTFRH